MTFDFRILILVLFVLIFGLIRKNQERTDKKKVEPENPGNLDDYFFDNLNKREIIPFLRTFNPSDLIVLRSLLDSDGIISMVNFNKMNSLYPNLTIYGHTDTILYICREDREKALEITKEYIAKIIASEKTEKRGVVRNIAEMALGSVVVPSGRSRTLPEIIGEGE